MRHAIRFLLGNELRAVSDVDPTMTVLQYLRTAERRTGTKEGCAEGDCGACTVVVGRPHDGAMQYRAVNACILFLPMIDGCQVLTVEDLAAPDGTLHPVQQALVEHHGSQCGYCTPGFVMALYAMLQEGGAVTRQRIDDTLAGNLCRCTGYGPIVAAARAVGEAGKREDDVAAQLADLDTGEPLALTHGDVRYFAPHSVEELAALLAEHPDAVMVAGATDVGLWVTKQHRRLDPVIWLGRVDALNTLHHEKGAALEIGAGVTYSDVHETLADLYPDFGEVIRRLGGRQIRNTGTVGGNIANGSPIGDTPPVLIALGATLVLRSAAGRRRLPLEDYFIDYGVQDRRPGEFVETVTVPLDKADWALRCYKISKRFDQDISAVLGAFHLCIADGVVADARIAYGGMAATPKRATACEQAIIGRPWTEDTVAAGQQALERDFTPLTDMRASAAYRMTIARNLLRKAYLETSGAAGKTRVLSDLGAVA